MNNKKHIWSIFVLLILTIPCTGKIVAQKQTEYFSDDQNLVDTNYYLDNGRYEVYISKTFNTRITSEIYDRYLTDLARSAIIFDEKISIYGHNEAYIYGNLGYMLSSSESHPVVVEFIYDILNDKLYLNNTTLESEELQDWKDIIQKVPNDIIPLEVKQIYLDDDQTDLERGGGQTFSLPWKNNTSWRLTGGAHALYSPNVASYYHNQYTTNQNYSVWNALDFSGPKNSAGQYTDKKVRAIADGTVVSVYKTSSGIPCQLSIRHGENVFIYLHLGNNSNKNYYVGQKISAQEELGEISNNCGQSTGPHVHFAVKNKTNTSPVEVAGLELGGNKVSNDYLKNTIKTYNSCLERNGQKFCPGNYIYNYGEQSEVIPNYNPTTDEQSNNSRSNNREKGIIQNKDNKLTTDDTDFKLYWNKGIYIDHYEIYVKNSENKILFDKKNIDDSDSNFTIDFNLAIISEIKSGGKLEFILKSVFEDDKYDQDSFILSVKLLEENTSSSRKENKVKGKITSQITDLEYSSEIIIDLNWKKGIYIENYRVEIYDNNSKKQLYFSRLIDDSDSNSKIKLNNFSSDVTEIELKLLTQFEDMTTDSDSLIVKIAKTNDIQETNNSEEKSGSRSDQRQSAKINEENTKLDIDNKVLNISWVKGIYVESYEIQILRNNNLVSIYRGIDDSDNNKSIQLSAGQVDMYSHANITIKLVTIFEDKTVDETLFDLNKTVQNQKEELQIEDNTNVLTTQNSSDTSTGNIDEQNNVNEKVNEDNTTLEASNEPKPNIIELNYDNLIYKKEHEFGLSNEYKIILPKLLQQSDLNYIIYAKKGDIYNKYDQQSITKVNDFLFKINEDYNYYVVQISVKNSDNARNFYLLLTQK